MITRKKKSGKEAPISANLEGGSPILDIFVMSKKTYPRKESAQKAQRRHPLLYGWKGFLIIFKKVYVGAYFSTFCEIGEALFSFPFTGNRKRASKKNYFHVDGQPL